MPRPSCPSAVARPSRAWVGPPPSPFVHCAQVGSLALPLRQVHSLRSLRLARARHCSTSLQPTSCPGKQYARCAARALPRVPMAVGTHRRTEEGREADRSVHRVQGECQRYRLAGSSCGAAASHPTHRVSAAAGHASHAMLRCAAHRVRCASHVFDACGSCRTSRVPTALSASGGFAWRALSACECECQLVAQVTLTMTTKNIEAKQHVEVRHAAVALRCQLDSAR